MSFYNENPGEMDAANRPSWSNDDTEGSDNASYFSIYPEFDGNVSVLTALDEFDEVAAKTVASDRKPTRGNLMRAASLSSLGSFRRAGFNRHSGILAESSHSKSKPLSKRATQILDGASAHRQPDPMLRKRISDLWASQHSHRNTGTGGDGGGSKPARVGRGAGMLQRASSARALRMSGLGDVRGLGTPSPHHQIAGGGLRSTKTGHGTDESSGHSNIDIPPGDTSTPRNNSNFQESMFSFFEEEITITEGDGSEEDSET